MFSVQDLLIAHGYKPSTSSTPTEGGSGLARHGRGDGPAQEAGQRWEGDHRNRDAAVSNPSDARSQSERQGTGAASHGWTQRRLCPPLTEKEVSYWRRKGQDFSVLLDYTDNQRPCGVDHRGKHQGWDDVPGLRDRDVDQELLRMTAERRWQSLGMEEWKPAVGLGRQPSDGLSDQWALEPCHAKTAEGSVHLTTKGKSRSLPKGLMSDGLQYTTVPATGPTMYTRQHVDATDFPGPYIKQHSTNGQEQRAEPGLPVGLASLFPKPRISRSANKILPHEAQQQTQDSLEMLPGDMEPGSRNREIYLPQGRELRQDCFAGSEGSCLGPPGYIPPPSYKWRSQQDHRKLSNLQYKGQVGPGAYEAGRWFFRPSGSWFDCEGTRSVPCEKLAFPGYLEQHMGCVQYLPFSDPRVQHFSGGQYSSSLTDSDKIRKIHTETPSTEGIQQSASDGAFRPAKGLIPNTDSSEISFHVKSSGSNLYNSFPKENNNFATFDQDCNKYHTKYQAGSSVQNGNRAQMVTKVKKLEPDTEGEKTKPIKRKVNETIFCLVSIPVQSEADKSGSDLNNNEPVSNPAEEGSPARNENRHLVNQTLKSTSLTSLRMQPISRDLENGRAAGKDCLEKDIAVTQAVELSKHIGLRYSGSWPGDQYRDQETQTTFVEGLSGSPQGCSSFGEKDQGPSIFSSTSERNLVTDCSSLYRFQAMKGQKSLNPSSNSAFSKTSTYSSVSNKSTVPTGCSSGNQKEANRWLSQKTEILPSAGDSHEAFGQFLLKPVNRRPCDAIEELESFNKELEDQFAKQVGMDKCLKNLGDAYRDIQESSTTSSNLENDRMQFSKATKQMETLSDSICRSNKTKLKNWNSTTDPEHRELKSAFSRLVSKPASFSSHVEEEMPVLSEGGTTKYSAPSGNLKKTGAEWKRVKVDVPIQKDSRDVNVASQPHCKMLWATKKNIQDTSILTRPPDKEDHYHALQTKQETESWNWAVPPELRTRYVEKGSLQNPYKDFVLGSDSVQETLLWRAGTKADMSIDVSVPKFTEEFNLNASTIKSHGLNTQRGPCWIIDNRLTQEKDVKLVSHVAGSDCHDSDQMSQHSAAERHLETLLIKEKANTVPVEDLSGLYEVKYAKGIPRNETIEQRAARILGIDVPAESLCAAEQKEAGQIQNDTIVRDEDGLQSRDDLEHSASESVLHVHNEFTAQCEKADARSVLSNGWVQEVTELKSDGNIVGTVGGVCTRQNSRAADEFLTEETQHCISISNNDENEVLREETQQCTFISNNDEDDILTEETQQCISIKNNEDEVLAWETQQSISISDNDEYEVLTEETQQSISVSNNDDSEGLSRLWDSNSSCCVVETLAVEGAPLTFQTGSSEMILATEPRHFSCGNFSWSRGEEVGDPKDPCQPKQRPRGGTVAKREITLPPDLCGQSNSALVQDLEELMLSDLYDPSHVEKV